MSERNNQFTKNSKQPPRGPRRGPHALSMPVEKAKNVKETLKRLLLYLRPKWFSMIIVIIVSILSTIFSIVSPKIMGLATTEIFDGFISSINSNKPIEIDFKYILSIIVTLIILYTLSSIFLYVTNYIMVGIAQKTVVKMRNEVSDKLTRLPLKYYDSNSHGDILSRVTNDVDNISNTLGESVTNLITSVVTILGVIVMMLTINLTMTLIVFISLPMSIIVTKKIASTSQRYFKEQQKKLGMLNGHVEEMFTGHKLVKVYNKENLAIKKFNEINDELYDVGWKAQFISGIIMPIMSLVNNIGYVFVSVVGGLLVIKGTLTIGNVQAFIQYSRQFSHPIARTASAINLIQSTIASAERVFELLDEEEEVSDHKLAVELNEFKGNIEFKNVKFGYSADKILMKNLNINVKSGQTIAIVGPTGAGKTTLVNLLMRFYEIFDGEITVDEKRLTDIKRGELRSEFGMVLQDTWLFNGSIKDNIAYGNQNANEEEIINASIAARADHFIRTLPEGYETILNEEATNISEGQKQLITIARAILSNPTILILDEATSRVDTRTELLIQNAMNTLMKGRTNFVIAHRLSTIRDADLILVMNEGDIIETGTHEELLDMNGFYSELYNSQFVG